MRITFDLEMTSIAQLRRWLVMGNVAFALTLCGLSWSSLRDARQGDEDAARLTAQNLAASMSSEVGTELRLIDNALATVAERYASISIAGERLPVLGKMLQEQQVLLRHARAVRWADSQGLVQTTTNAGAAMGPIGLTDYFSSARSRDQTVVSPPIKDAATGRWSTFVARRLISADGGFDGIVFMELTSEHFAQLFSRLELGSSGAIAMREADSHVLVARYSAAEPNSTKGLGEAVVSDALRTNVIRQPERGAYVTRTAIDQVERITAYRRVADFPLIVYAGLSTQEYLAAWRRQAAEMGAIVALMVGLIASISVLLFRGQRLERERREASDRVAHEQQLMLENDLVGMMRLRSRVILWNNRALNQLLGYDVDELRGVSMRELYLDDDTFDHIGAHGYAALRAGERFRAQVQLRGKDGTPVWVDLSGMRVTDDESLWMVSDIDALKRSEELAQTLALRDGLTGLPNRRLFEEKLADALAAAVRTDTSVAVCYLDLDGFKPINDVHGHEAGDEVLRAVAARLQHTLRATDVVARLGGDEFAIVLAPSTDVQQTHLVLQRCLLQIQRSLLLDSGHRVSVSASMGFVVADGTWQASDILRRADQAMYAAKRAGKGRIWAANLAGHGQAYSVTHKGAHAELKQIAA